jgi:hypothetical protein
MSSWTFIEYLSPQKVRRLGTRNGVVGFTLMAQRMD